MKIFFLTTATALVRSFTFGQTVEELYNSKNFNELVKFDGKLGKLTGEELYMVGFAFFRLENDNKAIELYDKAITNGLNDGGVHFYKGLSLTYLKKYDEAMREVEIAIKLEPTNQEFLNQKGEILYFEGKLDKALAIFEQAEQLPKTFPEPFFWVARIYHEKQDFDKALSSFYIAMDNIPKKNSYYLQTLTSIGLLEFTHTKNYLKSAKAYSAAIGLDPKNYTLYPKLMKAYNEAKEFSKADSVFTLMKIAFNNSELSEEDMKYKNVAIDEDEWNGQKISIYKYLTDPQKDLDVYYKVYLLSKEGDKIERTFLVEQTFPNPDDAKYILCETNRKLGIHYTYPYGWKTDNIPIIDLKKAVELVLDGKMKFGAYSKSE